MRQEHLFQRLLVTQGVIVLQDLQKVQKAGFLLKYGWSMNRLELAAMNKMSRCKRKGGVTKNL